MNIRLNKFFDFWNKHPFAFPFVFLLIVWAPYTLISYPGNMCSDAYIELCQFFGEFTFTSHHPPFYTLLIGYFVKFGRVVFDSANIGLFLYIIFQYIISAAVMAYTLFAMQKMNSPMWLRMLSIFIYGFMPHFISYVALMQKDMLYCMAFVTFMTQIMLMFVQKKKFWTVGNIAVTVLSMTFALLLRNNGKHVILPLVIVILVKFLWDIKKKAISSEEFSKCVFMLVLPLVLFSAATSFMVKKYNISDGSIKEVLSLPFQQTARYVRDYSDEVTPNERAAIDKLLDYDNLGELYDEEICDPVKSTFKNDYEKSDLVNYFKVWFKQFTKHPWCYFEATLNQNYFILYPFDETLNMYTSTTGVYNLSGNANKLDKYRSLGITECKPLTSFQSVFINLYRLTSRMPFLGLLCSNAFYILLLLCLLIYAINKKNYSVLLVSIPLVMTILVIIASPVISTHPRYAFPISYLMPLFTGFYLYVNSNKKEKKMQAKAKS